MIDPEGLLGRYGNWCGRGWSGGKEKYLDDMTEKERKHLLQPIDDKDYCCMQHDYCYYYCRKKNIQVGEVVSLVVTLFGLNVQN